MGPHLPLSLLQKNWNSRPSLVLLVSAPLERSRALMSGEGSQSRYTERASEDDREQRWITLKSGQRGTAGEEPENETNFEISNTNRRQTLANPGAARADLKH